MCTVETHNLYIHLYAHLIPTSQCFGDLTATSCNFPHKATVCNTGTGFKSHTVTFHKHLKFGRAAATTSPAPKVGEGQLIFHNYHILRWSSTNIFCEYMCVRVTVYCLGGCLHVHVRIKVAKVRNMKSELCASMCVFGSENTPDALHLASSSCRDRLWLRLDRQDWRKLRSPQPRCIFFRWCAAAKLDDTLDQSSAVGYKWKEISRWCYHNTLRHLPMVKHSE